MWSSGYSGFSSVSSKAYDEIVSRLKAKTGVSAFTHSANIKRGKVAAEAHESMDPSKIKDGAVGKRESRDSDTTGNSNPIAVFFDVTGSMGRVPRVLQTKLVKLMSTLLQKGVIEDPQILYGAIGDTYSDKVPLQVGQFESDMAMEDNIDKIYLEGNGGGNRHESYDLAFYFLANLVSLDSVEKRNKRGYAFIIGDELGYDKVKPEDVKRVFGIDIPESISIEEAVRKAEENFEVFWICPVNEYYGSTNMDFWKNLLPERVLELEDPDLVCELIATTIGMAEGTVSGVSAIADSLGISGNQVNVVERALTTYKGRELSAKVSGGQLAVAKDSLGV